MANKQDYLAQLQGALSHLHNCGATYVQTVPVNETFHGRTVWQGEVEVFDLTGHPRAKRCYAWVHYHGKYDQQMRVETVLEIPPVVSPETAVRAAIMADVRTGQK